MEIREYIHVCMYHFPYTLRAGAIRKFPLNVTFSNKSKCLGFTKIVLKKIDFQRKSIYFYKLLPSSKVSLLHLINKRW